MSSNTPTIKLSKLKKNPDNPRIIKDAKFQNLVQDLLKYGKFLEKRPIVHKDWIVQGGNQRLAGLIHIIKLPEQEFSQLVHSPKIKLDADIHELWNLIRKDKAIPASWVANMDDYTVEEVKAFTIIDNISFGEWQWDQLANEWNQDQLADWGLNVAGWKAEENSPDLLPLNNNVDTSTHTVSFEVTNNPGATHNDYSVFEQSMLHTNKVALLEVLNQVKNKHNLERLEDALMHIANYYKTHNANG